MIDAIMREQIICPVCQDKNVTLFFEGTDFFLTKEKFSIWKCGTCEVKFTTPVPGENEISRYYESDEYISHDAQKGGLVNRIYKLARKFAIRSKYNLVKKYSKGRKLLDIGCGTGEFLHFCAEKGFNCQGIEPNGKARAFAKRKYNLSIREKIHFTPEERGSLDCITMWHVLEHIEDPGATLRTLGEVLRPDGILIIALPNPDSWDARYYEKFWAAFDLPRHLFHFNRQSFLNLAKNAGFIPVKILPQKLDSFYISMLSEKYLTGRSPNLVKAFFNGVYSNFKANDISYGHSSLIYVLTRENS
jgi:SAM-dependent methyltransferase